MGNQVVVCALLWHSGANIDAMDWVVCFLDCTAPLRLNFFLSMHDFRKLLSEASIGLPQAKALWILGMLSIQFGDTALHYAARGEHSEVCRVLAEAGADSTIPNRVPLVEAVRC